MDSIVAIIAEGNHSVASVVCAKWRMMIAEVFRLTGYEVYKIRYTLRHNDEPSVTCCAVWNVFFFFLLFFYFFLFIFTRRTDTFYAPEGTYSARFPHRGNGRRIYFIRWNYPLRGPAGREIINIRIYCRTYYEREHARSRPSYWNQVSLKSFRDSLEFAKV